MKELHLTSLVRIEKNELVVCFTSREINSNSHYIRHNTTDPNSYLEGNEVFAIDAIQPNTELKVFVRFADKCNTKISYLIFKFFIFDLKMFIYIFYN